MFQLPLLKNINLTHNEFKILFDENFDAIRRYVYYRCGDGEQATDVTQECFLKLWEKRNKIKLSKVKGLLYKMASDIFISKYRQEIRSQQFLKDFVFEKNDSSPEELLTFEQLKEKYENLIQHMPEKQRIVFLMSRIDGLKYHEIANNLNLSVKAVEKRMKNAIGYLRTSLIINE